MLVWLGDLIGLIGILLWWLPQQDSAPVRFINVLLAVHLDILADYSYKKL